MDKMIFYSKALLVYTYCMLLRNQDINWGTQLLSTDVGPSIYMFI